MVGRDVQLAMNYVAEQLPASAPEHSHHPPAAPLLDVWKADYEPYWVDLTRLLTGMVPVSPVSGTPRGYLALKRG